VVVVECRGFAAPMNWLFYLGGPWGLLIPAFVPALLLLAAWQDRRRPPDGHCRACGYNLMGNVSGRCPECVATI